MSVQKGSRAAESGVKHLRVWCTLYIEADSTTTSDYTKQPNPSLIGIGNITEIRFQYGTAVEPKMKQHLEKGILKVLDEIRDKDWSRRPKIYENPWNGNIGFVLRLNVTRGQLSFRFDHGAARYILVGSFTKRRLIFNGSDLRRIMSTRFPGTGRGCLLD